MDQGPLTKRIVESFEGMSAQLQIAARYLLDHPPEVALLSMREQARQAGVQPATMTRLAKYLGLDGFETIRELYADAVRGGSLGFTGKAGFQVASQKLKGDKALTAAMAKSVSRQIASLEGPEQLEDLTSAAALLASARRIYCLGLRASYPVAWHLHYVLSLVCDRCILLNDAAGTGADALRKATEEDVLVAVSILPYTRATVEVTRHVAKQAVPVVALTDSQISPLAQLASHTVLVATDSPSFFHTMVPAFAAAEMLAVLVAGHGGEATLKALQETDEQLAAMNMHFSQRQR